MNLKRKIQDLTKEIGREPKNNFGNLARLYSIRGEIYLELVKSREKRGDLDKNEFYARGPERL